MNKLFILVLLVVSLCPAIGLAQDDDTIDFGAIVEQMSAQCPYEDGNWAVTTVAMTGDTIVVEIEAPASISGFLPSFTGNSMNVKRLWVEHIMGYGDDLKHLVELMAEEGKPLLLTIRPKKSEECPSIYVSGKEIGTILATD